MIDGLITHADLVRDQLAHPPLGSMRAPGAGTPVRAGISGTGKDLLVLGWSANDLQRERAAGVRLLTQLGLGAEMRIANALPGALTTPGSLLLGDVVQDLGGLDVPLGAVDSEAAAKQAWTLIDLVEPAVIVLNTPSALQLFGAAPARKRPWLRGIIWLQIDGDGGGVPAVGEAAGFSGWERTWLAVPEVTSFVAVSCSAQRFHLDTRVDVDVVDGSKGSSMDDGEVGELAITALDMETDLRRYLSRVRGRTMDQRCPCGTDGHTLTLVW
jgi:phenylacetate-coenzyme A ligase PaaK-like adenylate-forming protein